MEPWRHHGGFLPVQDAREATMGLMEISVILACASAFGFYITAGDH